ncbi:MAG: hypothetical protein U1A78_16595 [Polyangia bacterium]
MDAQEDRDLLLWTSFKREACGLCLDEPEQALELAVRLITDWGSNRPDMRRVLLQGIYRGELPEAVLPMWDSRWAQDAAQPDADADERTTQPRGVPPELVPLERAIGECSRKQGRAALELGRHLLAARARCEACGYRFESFLIHLRRLYGINRATCYMYVKFAEWEMPDSLGTAVMKWIVQGFEQGSTEALQVIRAAVEQGLTLEALKVSYGDLRRPSAATTRRLADAQGGEREPGLREELIQQRQRLLARRAQIEKELCLLDSRLQALESQGRTWPGPVAACDGSKPERAAPQQLRSEVAFD